MKPLDLHGLHEAAGARFVMDRGHLLPASYGDSAEEQRYVREAAGLVDRGYRGILDLSGERAATLLDGLFSSAVRRLKPGEGQRSCLLSPRGMLVGAFLLYGLDENTFRLVFAEPLRDSLVSMIEKYAFLEDVRVSKRSEDTAILSVEGVSAAEVLQPLVTDGTLPTEAATFSRTVLAGVPTGIARAGESPERGLDVWAPREARQSLWESLTEATRRAGGGPVGQEAAEALRIEAGVPRHGREYDEHSFPSEVDLEDALTFEKCYVGQEVVARMRSYGHANWGLRGLLVPGKDLPAPDARLLAAGEDAGRLTSWAYSTRLGSIVGLGRLHRKFLQEETLEVEAGGEGRDARLVELPFVAPR
jgi:folate-binding protein YgfZ